MAGVVGRSTRSLDRMRFRLWLAIAVIAVWADQAIYLWPLPSEAASQSVLAGDPKAIDANIWWESQLWLGWFTRILVIPLGIASGLSLLRNYRRWPAVLFVTSVGCFLLFRGWQWLFMYAPLFSSLDNAIYRGTWLLHRPQFIFNSIVFPGVLLLAAIYASIELVHRRWARHAI